MPFTSNLRFYSYGIATEDREVSDDQYGDGTPVETMFSENRKGYFTPTEVTPYIDKELKRNEFDIELKGEDASEQDYNVTLTSVTDIPAYYLPLSGDAKNIPHLKKGETVILWQYADEDRFYWTPTGTGQHLRREDHHGIYVAATKEADEELKLGENVYSHEVSGSKQKIESKTTTANGEPNELNMTLDAKEGKTEMGDDDGNKISTDAKKKQAKVENSQGTKLDMEGSDFTLQNDTVSVEGDKGELKLNAPNITLDGPSNLNGPVTVMAAPLDSYIKAVASGMPPPINPALAGPGSPSSSSNGSGGGGGKGGRSKQLSLSALPGGRAGIGPANRGGSPGISGGIGAPGGTVGTTTPGIDTSGMGIDTGGLGVSAGNNTASGGIGAGSQSTGSGTTGQVNVGVDANGFVCAMIAGMMLAIEGPVIINEFGIAVDIHGFPVSLDIIIPRLSLKEYELSLELAWRLNCKIGNNYGVAVNQATTISTTLGGMPGDHQHLITNSTDAGERVFGSNEMTDLMPGCDCVMELGI